MEERKGPFGPWKSGGSFLHAQLGHGHPLHLLGKLSGETRGVDPPGVVAAIRGRTPLEALHEVGGRVEEKLSIHPIQAEGDPEEVHLDPDVSDSLAFGAGPMPRRFSETWIGKQNGGDRQDGGADFV